MLCYHQTFPKLPRVMISTGERDLSDHNSTTITGQLSVVIVRLSALGDVIHGMPAVCALRRALPHARIAWVVEGRAAGVLEGHHAIDELIVLQRGWLRSPATLWQIRNRLRALRCDVAIDMQGLSKSAVVAWLSAAPRRIGMSGRWGREISPWLNNEFVPVDNLHPIPRALRLVELAGSVIGSD